MIFVILTLSIFTCMYMLQLLKINKNTLMTLAASANAPENESERYINIKEWIACSSLVQSITLVKRLSLFIFQYIVHLTLSDLQNYKHNVVLLQLGFQISSLSWHKYIINVIIFVKRNYILLQKLTEYRPDNVEYLCSRKKNLRFKYLFISYRFWKPAFFVWNDTRRS